MSHSGTPNEQGWGTRIGTLLVAASLLLLNYPGSHPEPAGASLHDEHGETGAIGGAADLPGGLVFYKGATGEAPIFVLADVTVDEEFVEQMGQDWEPAVEETLEAANELLSAVGLNVRSASIQQWQSDDALSSIASQISLAEKQVRRDPGRLLLAITGQSTVTYDGWARESGSRAIVRFYRGDSSRTQFLIAHEIGHLLGARHHEDDEQCQGDGCIMDRKGYVHATKWCDHHRQQIEEYVTPRVAF